MHFDIHLVCEELLREYVQKLAANEAILVVQWIHILTDFTGFMQIPMLGFELMFIHSNFFYQQ